jgi:hypothetical protein
MSCWIELQQTLRRINFDNSFGRIDIYTDLVNQWHLHLGAPIRNDKTMSASLTFDSVDRPHHHSSGCFHSAPDEFVVVERIRRQRPKRLGRDPQFHRRQRLRLRHGLDSGKRDDRPVALKSHILDNQALKTGTIPDMQPLAGLEALFHEVCVRIDNDPTDITVSASDSTDWNHRFPL